ncbi:MAG: 3-deoxy-manno-octulosonate cytidylyltransferase [Gammaproteobacteria bacterium]
MTAFKVAIPARYASTRLPGKPLLELAGKPLVQHVWERAGESGADEVVIATDDDRIARVAEGFGARVCMTRPDHPSGTDRLAEVAQALGWADQDIVVNLQGDEPLTPGAYIDQVAADLAAYTDAVISTLATPVSGRAEVFDPNAVKVSLDRTGYALTFSRAPLPWWRDGFGDEAGGSGSGIVPLPANLQHLRHIGIYAYRAGFLRRYSALEPSPLEQVESLEQLRVLWHGERIHVSVVDEPPGHGVDTPEDLARAEQVLLQR